MFGQYGGQVFWDRTAVVADGKERVIVEDDLPAGRPYSSSWKWVDKPARSGKAAHTLDRYSGSYRAHGVYGLEHPIAEHLPFVREEAATILKRHIPKLGANETTWGFFESLLYLTGTGPQSRIEQHQWFLTQSPDHPRGVDVLKRLLDYHRSAKAPDPVAAVETVITECRPPIETRYLYRRRYLTTGTRFIRNWLVLGSFPNTDGKGLDASFPPESEAVDMQKHYDGVAGPIRWTPHEAKENQVKLSDLFTPNENVVAYAVCWIRNPRRRSATLEIGSDDGCKVWLARKVVLTHSQSRSIYPRQNIVPVRLRRGWSEFMIKVEQKGGQWGFYFEVVDAEGRSLLDDVKVSIVPPGGRE